MRVAGKILAFRGLPGLKRDPLSFTREQIEDAYWWRQVELENQWREGLREDAQKAATAAVKARRERWVWYRAWARVAAFVARFKQAWREAAK